MSDSNIILVESPERRVITSPNKRLHTASMATAFKYSRTKSRLPKNFHQTVIELENNFSKEQSFEIMTEILTFYKAGVEYYSGKNRETQADLLNRMQIFLSNKAVIKLMKRNSKIMKRKMHDSILVPRKMSSDNCLNNLRKHSSGNLAFDLQRYSRKPTPKNSLSSHENIKKSYASSKDTLKNFEARFNNGCMKLEDEINYQRNQFLENLKMKIYKQKLRADSTSSSRRQSFIKRVNVEKGFQTHSPNRILKINLDELQNVRKFELNEGKQSKKHSRNNSYNKNPGSSTNVTDESKITFPIFCMNEIIIPDLKRKKILLKKNSKDISDVLDDYLNKLHINFYNKLLEGSFKMSLDIMNEGYKNKIKNFEEYVEQKIEVEMLIDDNPNELTKKSYTQLLNSLRLENERELIEINRTTNSNISRLVSLWSNSCISGDEKICELNEDLMSEVVEIFK